MDHGIQIRSIPEADYSDYRYRVIFEAFKWDPQVEDHNTISRHVVILPQHVLSRLESWAEKLSQETIALEQVLAAKPGLAQELSLPWQIRRNLKRLSTYEANKHVRLMRFDFHPTITGWSVSEVNSDVPGGLAEASILPQIAANYFPDSQPWRNIGQSILAAFRQRISPPGRIAFVHATSYADDRQVMEFLAACFQQEGFQPIFTAPDHLRWKDNKAYCILEGFEGEIDGIVRFFPLEWLPNLPLSSHWQGYFDCQTVSCNHPIAIFAQSKRLPLVWDKAQLELPTWKELLPETNSAHLLYQQEPGWIYKPALGRVGEDISIQEAVTEKELKAIHKMVKRHPRQWLAQRMFDSQPIITPQGEKYHLCVGAFTVDGKSAGFYGRLSPHRRIDARAKDVPILALKSKD